MNWIQKVRLHKSESGSLSYEIARKLSRGRLARLLLNRTNPKYFNHTARRVNKIMNGKDFTYLEIGVANGTTFQSINASHKHGVDPFPLFNYKKLPVNTSFDKKTSDQYFDSLKKSQQFDFIFLDGLHESNQLLKDLINSLHHIKLGGWILLDDMVPSDSISAIPDINESYLARGVQPNEGFPWHGDCFKLLPIVMSYLQSCTPYLIIYPDNPQLLIHVGSGQTELDKDLKGLKSVDLSKMEIDYPSTFSHSNLVRYPIYLEEHLVSELSRFH
jgi:Methyltransferase domain